MVSNQPIRATRLPAGPWPGSPHRRGLARSAFAAHFTRLVGRAPLQYLTYRRMQHAQRLLRASNAGIRPDRRARRLPDRASIQPSVQALGRHHPGACRRGRWHRHLPAQAAIHPAAGGKILKPAAKLQWGGYGGSFADPDGYIWNIGYSAEGKDQPYAE
jgi:AraC-like DNA-binding protein